MKRQLLFVAFLLICTLFLQVLTPTTFQMRVGDEGTTPSIGKGVNYLSLYHAYSSKYTTDEVLRRDFSRFQHDRINVISLSLFWYRLEGNARGDYDGEYAPYPEEIGGPFGKRFLDDVKRVIRIADEYHIRVLVTFHTLWGENDSAWCTPDYVVDPVTGKNIGLAIVRSEEAKQAFVAMFKHTVSYLAGTKGIWAWAILNEPWYWPHNLDPPYQNIDQKQNFIDLIQKLSDVVKTLDGRPVTIRFCNTHVWVDRNGVPKIKNIFTDDWNWDQRIFGALDFISFNAYIPCSALCSVWKNITDTNMMGSIQLKKGIWITEFGFKSNDDAVQERSYCLTWDFFRGLAVDCWIAWYWRGDTYQDGLDILGEGYNLCGNCMTGEGRKAYHAFAKWH